MKYAVTTPPTGKVVEWSALDAHLVLDGDTSKQPLVFSYLDAATDHAQEELAASLLPQTLTATYWRDDLQPARLYPAVYQQASDYQSVLDWGSYQQGQVLSLPRGPVRSISSITDGNGNNVTNFRLERYGNEDVVRVFTGLTFPVTIIYAAGYANADAIPAGIKQAILAHVGTLFLHRESVTDKPLKAVPHSLESFYAKRSRNTGIG